MFCTTEIISKNGRRAEISQQRYFGEDELPSIDIDEDYSFIPAFYSLTVERSEGGTKNKYLLELYEEAVDVNSKLKPYMWSLSQKVVDGVLVEETVEEGTGSLRNVSNYFLKELERVTFVPLTKIVSREKQETFQEEEIG